MPLGNQKIAINYRSKNWRAVLSEQNLPTNKPSQTLQVQKGCTKSLTKLILDKIHKRDGKADNIFCDLSVYITLFLFLKSI